MNHLIKKKLRVQFKRNGMYLWYCFIATYFLCQLFIKLSCDFMKLKVNRNTTTKTTKKYIYF